MKHNGHSDSFRNEARPPSAAQERIWRIEESRPKDPALHVAARFELTGDLDHSALEAALNEVVRQQESSHAGFEMRDGRLTLTIPEERRIDLPVTDMTGDATRAAVDQWCESKAREPFDLRRAPLVRAHLLRLGDTRHTLLVTSHRLASVSIPANAFASRLGASYGRIASGGSGSPAEPPLPGQAAGAPLPDGRSQQFELMPDFPRTGGAHPRGGIVLRQVPAEIVDRLQELGGDSARVATLAALLARYTGESDIVFSAAGPESLGPCGSDPVLVEVDAAGDPSFVDLQRCVEQRLEQRIAPAALPRIHFAPHDEATEGWTRAGLRLEPLPPICPGALYDLEFRLSGCTISCQYNKELYRQETVEALLEHWERLCADVVEQPGGKLSELSLLSPAETRKLLVDWNSTSAAYPRDRGVHELFEQTVARVPGNIAVEFDKATLSFAELEARSNRLAQALALRGAGPGSLVGIFLDRSLDMVASVLAVLKTGAAYVPLDPAFPPSRLEFMASDAGLRILITSATLAGTLKTGAAALLVDSAEARNADSSPLGRKIDSESLAYVLYTSGSTGKPKGVEVRHRSVVNLLYAMQSHVGLEAGGSLLAVTTLSFDIAALELFLPLITGARLVLASREQASDPRALRALLNASQASLMQATPGTWRMLAEAGWRGSPGLKILVGGEKVTREVADLLLDLGQAVWNCYGPTETTVWSTICRLEKDGRPISIGRPLANTTLYVLDRHGHPLPPGAAGELLIGGDGVGRGYLNRPELTAERFIPNPFGPGTLYRTGDIVRYRPDGCLEILGRNDAQVKIRGFRIELGDVESALSACPGVREAAVVVRESAAGEPVLAGYYVAGETLNQAEVRSLLAQRMPPYMVPTVLMRMTEFPRTPNGKIDRKALPVVAPKEEAAANAPASQDSLEATLIGIWESILGTRPIRATDNFFDLGGESVMAARIFVRMETVLGKTLPLATLFQAPTIEKLAEVIRRKEWKPMWSSLVPIRPEGSKPPFFFVHPIGGNVLNFSGFCSHFGRDQPIYGLQARGLDNEVAPHTSVEEMASDYIESIRTVQAEGPYFIGGFSAGGVVAFEMARQLQAAAQPVGILALLDTEILTLVQGSVSLEERLNHWWRMFKINLRYAGRMSIAEYVEKKSFNLRMRRKLFAWDWKERLGLAIDPSTLNVEEAFLLAFKRYRPSPFYGDATLFRAGDGAEYLDPRLGWGDIIRGRLEIEEVSGDHDTILQEPHIGMLARLLEACLTKASGSEPEPLAAMTAAAGTAKRVSALTPAIDLGKS